MGSINFNWKYRCPNGHTSVVVYPSMPEDQRYCCKVCTKNGDRGRFPREAMAKATVTVEENPMDFPESPVGSFPKSEREVANRLSAYLDLLPFGVRDYPITALGRALSAYLDDLPETSQSFKIRDLTDHITEEMGLDDPVNPRGFTSAFPVRLLLCHGCQPLEKRSRGVNYLNPNYVHRSSVLPPAGFNDDDIAEWIGFYASLGFATRRDVRFYLGIDDIDTYYHQFNDDRRRGRRYMANTFATTKSWTGESFRQIAFAFGCSPSTLRRYIDEHADFYAAPPDPSEDTRFTGELIDEDLSTITGVWGGSDE